MFEVQEAGNMFFLFSKTPSEPWLEATTGILLEQHAPLRIVNCKTPMGSLYLIEQKKWPSF